MSPAKLILAEPFQARRHILINRNPFLIGRVEGCSLVLNRTGISKNHSSIIFDGERYILKDLKSKNGTLVNGSAVDQTELNDQDLITIGGVDLTFEIIREEEWKADSERNVAKLKSALASTRNMNTSLVLDPILDEIMDSLMELTQGERGFLLMETNGELRMVRSANITSEQFQEEEFELSRSAVDKAIKEQHAVAISNAVGDTFFGAMTSVQRMNLKTLVCVPIVIDGWTAGVLYADSSRKEQEFTDLDVEVLEYLASNAGIALENAKLNAEIWNFIQSASKVLEEVEGKALLDKSLQASVRNALDALAALRQKRNSGSVSRQAT